MDSRSKIQTVGKCWCDRAQNLAKRLRRCHWPGRPPRKGTPVALGHDPSISPQLSLFLVIFTTTTATSNCCTNDERLGIQDSLRIFDVLWFVALGEPEPQFVWHDESSYRHNTMWLFWAVDESSMYRGELDHQLRTLSADSSLKRRTSKNLWKNRHGQAPPWQLSCRHKQIRNGNNEHNKKSIHYDCK